MKINNIDILITKIDIKEKKDSKEKYLVINFLDVETGDMFSVIHREIEILGKIQPMSKYLVNLNLSSSKYGLRLELEDVKECKGEL